MSVVERRHIGFIDGLSIHYVNNILFKEHQFAVVVEDGKASKLVKEEGK